jgi:RNA polymerase sigma-70 factor (ECF subfamily)
LESGSAGPFAVLKAWLSFGEEPGSQAEAAARLGMNEGAVKVAIHRLRRRFREIVRMEVRQTLPEGLSEEAEIQQLIVALSGGGERPAS